MATTNDTLKIRIRSDGKGRVKADMQDVGRSFDETSDRAERLNRVGGRVSDTLRTIGAAAGALGVGLATRELTRNIMEYERLNAVLVTFEGNQKRANETFAELREFTSRTPFQLQNVVEAYTTLRARGINPTTEDLLRLGDIAAGSSRDIQQIAEATANALTGEMEMLKQFGVVARVEGEKLNVTFGGVTRTIERDAEAILGVLRDISTENFAGGMERQMDTVAGSLSNLKDELFELSVAVGEAGAAEAMKEAIQGVTEALREIDPEDVAASMDRLGQAVEVLIVLFGARLARSIARSTTAMVAGQVQAIRYQAALARMAGVSKSAAAGQIALGTASRAAGAGLAFIGGPVGAAVIALWGLHEVLQAGRERLEDIADVSPETADAVAAAMRAFKAGAEDADSAISTALANVRREMNSTKNELAALNDEIERRQSAPLAGSQLLGGASPIQQRGEAGALRERINELEDLRRQLQATRAVMEGTDVFSRIGEQLFPALQTFNDFFDSAGSAADATGELTKEQEKAEAQAEKYLDKLRQQVAEFGKSEAALIRYRAEQEAQQAATEETAQAIRDEADALASKITQEKRAELQAKMVREEREHRNRLIAEETENLKEAGEQLETYNEGLQAVIDKYDPARRAAREYNEEVRKLNEAFEKGMIGEGKEDLEALQKLLKAAAEDMRQVSLGNPDEDVDYWVTAWERGVERLDDMFADMWQEFLTEGEFSMERLQDAASQIGGELMNAMVTRPLTDQLTQFVQTGSMDEDFFAEGGQGRRAMGMMAGQAIGSLAGGGGQNANTGASIGSAIGSIWGPWGAMAGGAIGGFFGGRFDDDEIELNLSTSGQPRPGLARESALGGIQVMDFNNIPGSQLREIVNSLVEFDQQLAMLLGAIDPALVGEARAALEDWNMALEGEDMDVATASMDRFRRVMAETMPEFHQWLSRINDPDQALEALSGILSIQDQMENLGRIMDSIGAGPVEQVALSMAKLEEGLTDANQRLSVALQSEDPQRVAEAADNARQAVQEWMDAQIQLARQLQSELRNIRSSRRQFDRDIAGRLDEVTGGNRQLGVLEDQIPTLQNVVLHGDSPEQRMQALDEFLGTVDQWLEASRNRVNQWLQEQLSALDAEEEAIIAGARERAQEASRASQRAAQAAQQARQREIQALQEQLGLAQEWLRLSEELRDRIEGLTLSQASPLTGFQRLEELNRLIQEAQAERAGATGEDRIEASRRLEQLLTQRLQLVDDEALFQAPTAERRDLFNETVRMLEELRAEAEGRGEEADPLEEQLRALQRTTAGGFASVNRTSVQLTAAEQERLDEIEAEREAARQQAQDELESIDQEAADYYRWARQQGQDLHDQIEEDIAAQLEELTGGLPVQEFILQVEEQARDYLEEIRDSLDDFLDFLRLAIGPGVDQDNDWWVDPIGRDPREPGNPKDQFTNESIGAKPMEPGSMPVGNGGGEKGNSVVIPITVHAENAQDPKAVADQVKRGVDESTPLVVAELRKIFPDLVKENAPVIHDIKRSG